MATFYYLLIFMFIGMWAGVGIDRLVWNHLHEEE